MTEHDNQARLRVGTVGCPFMGTVHSNPWPNAHRFFDLPLVPELTAPAASVETSASNDSVWSLVGA